MGRGKTKVQVPECRYGAACTRRDCVFKHPPKPAKSVRQSVVEKSDKVCFAYVAGKCAFGRQCHDKHPDEASCLTIKERYSKIDCQWGRNCRTDGCLYRHPSDEPVGPALTLELKPQPAVYAAGYPVDKVEAKVERVERVEREREKDRGPVSPREPAQQLPVKAERSIEPHHGMAVERRHEDPIQALAERMIPDEEAQEQARQEQLAATLRCMGFDEDLQAVHRADGNLNRAVDDLLRDPTA
mmetsp:Transcript_88212/g.180262  ORF Transcript_88212/g.180262 Transcript_88212/m.180262 type:complete len:242 (-) Transcript_88212:9-734(-)